MGTLIKKYNLPNKVIEDVITDKGYHLTMIKFSNNNKQLSIIRVTNNLENLYEITDVEISYEYNIYYNIYEI